MSEATVQELYNGATRLLKQLIAMPSFSKEEQGTVDVLQRWLQAKGIAASRLMNNVWAKNKYYEENKPTILLNSHHDTVKPNKAYTLDPFLPLESDGKLFGLGSNDAGGSLVSLIAAFLYFYHCEDLKFNLIFAATAEEEISGANGIAALLPELGKIEAAIVGEPTLMDMAIAEKGLIVLDCTAVGKAGHAAREEGVNALYNAIEDIRWFNSYEFEKISSLLGKVKMSVTVINAGTQHNVVPATCSFTVDVRVNECYTNEEVLEIIKKNVQCDVRTRSLRLKPTYIDEQHPLVQAGKSIGRKAFGSVTLSDKALMPFPALKMGPGDSARSHMADEFIYLKEVEEGLNIYIDLLKSIV
ncbi:MAG: M20 family metallo-hydrolase [Taibaiella sp.]|nr:M20 family metallo-hydrolase [Taibaiella sp.]